MTWVLDTCVLLDLACNDKMFAACASRAIQAKLDDALTIAPITYVELAPQFLGNVERQNEFLRDLWIECDFGGSMDSVLAAHHAWFEHVLRKRKGEVAKRPIADVMIGAYALSKGGLITRNEGDFRSLYPALEIFNPATRASRCRKERHCGSGAWDILPRSAACMNTLAGSQLKEILNYDTMLEKYCRGWADVAS